MENQIPARVCHLIYIGETIWQITWLIGHINCAQGMQGRSLATLLESGASSSNQQPDYSVTVKDGRYYAGTCALMDVLPPDLLPLS